MTVLPAAMTTEREDLFYMHMALDLAAKATGFTSPNPLVGAVVVKNRRVVGRGWHEKAGKPHAEINALKDAGNKAKGATLYVTLEPCNHFGKTPPCTKAIIEAGIQRIVAAMRDPNPTVQGDGLDFLENHGIQVDVGVAESRAKRLNEAFITYIQTARPFVILKCAATLDGQVATRTGDSKWVTGIEARGFVHQIRHAVDAIMVGVNTIKIDDPQLTTRLENGGGKDPIRIILDTRLNIPETAKVLKCDSNSPTVLVAGDGVSLEKKNCFESMGAQVILSTEGPDGIDLPSLMTRLGQKGITSVLIEGGSRVAASALSGGIVDKLLLFYAPKILGGDDGIPIFKGIGPDLMKDCKNLHNVAWHFFGNDFMVEAYP
jgi:diaminohydroxyphosphoribosylaminopyrimidine deaminase/5-amino-6-(5-phosphoribosylamino)uracil reductase